jgi:exosortase
LALFRQAWLADPELAFGWGVPALAVYFAWARNHRRPAPAPVGSGGRLLAWFAAAGGMLVIGVALPVLDANTLWPTAQWAAAAAAGVVTLSGLALAGGLPWVLCFAFPVAFVSTALVWPTPLHVWIVANLAGYNARAAAEVVSAAGFPAIVTGNVIAVGNGFVGVAEACSGLRSLQAVWMEAWFFGELFSMNWPRRFGLVAFALAAAAAGNLLRTTYLTWQAAAHGLAESERWHDPAGAVELVGTLLLVAAAALWIGRGKSGDRIEKVDPAGRTDLFHPTSLPSIRRWSFFVLGGALIAEAGTQAWYLAHEGTRRTFVHWDMKAPGLDWRPVPLPERVEDVLQYSDAKGLTSRDPLTGASVLAFLVSWRGDAANGENPEWHDPTVCLPGSGATLAAVLGEFTVPIGGVSVPFAGYRFIVEGRTVQVFFCHWDTEVGGARGDARTAGFDVRERRLQRVWEGRRRSDVSHLTFELQEPSDAAAIAWLGRWAPRLLVPHFSAHELSL